MRIRMEPSLVVPPKTLRQFHGGRAESVPSRSVRVVDVDEDEATLAVAAVRELLGRSKTPTSRVSSIEVASHAGKGIAALVGRAVLGRPERATDRPWASSGSDHDEPSGRSIKVRVNAVRAGSPQMLEGQSSFAEASLAGKTSGRARTPTATNGPRNVLVGHELKRLARVGRMSLSRPSMGAYVPLTTWESEQDARYRLLASTCGNGHAFFPARSSCRACGARCRIRAARGPFKIHSFTVIAAGAAPTEFDFLQDAWGPYASMIVSTGTAGRIRIPALALDRPGPGLQIGKRVEPAFRRLYAQDGIWRYGTKFRLAATAKGT